jgi:hypothetical protein
MRSWLPGEVVLGPGAPHPGAPHPGTLHPGALHPGALDPRSPAWEPLMGG